MKKITIHVSQELLDRARSVSDAGITETVRRGLELVAARKAYASLRALKGKVKFSIDLDELRKD